MVPTARLELAQLSPLPPQDSVSTNFTTSARGLFTSVARPARLRMAHRATENSSPNPLGFMRSGSYFDAAGAGATAEAAGAVASTGALVGMAPAPVGAGATGALAADTGCAADGRSSTLPPPVPRPAVPM